MCINYLKQELGEGEDALGNKVELIDYCKELLQDETQQLQIDMQQQQLLFMGSYAITLQSMSDMWGYIVSILVILFSYLASKYFMN